MTVLFSLWPLCSLWLFFGSILRCYVAASMTCCRLIAVFGPAGNCRLQRLNFLLRERPHGARRQIAEPHRADGDAFELLHFVADAGQQAADFAVAAFVQNHFEDRRPLPPALDSHVLDVGKTFGQVDAAMQLREHFALDLARPPARDKSSRRRAADA